jgi:hypothetical protein
MVIFKLKSHAMASQDWFVVGALPQPHRCRYLQLFEAKNGVKTIFHFAVFLPAV